MQINEGKASRRLALSDLRTTEVIRRVDYQPVHPQELFIVPLLRENIERIITSYVAPDSTVIRALDIGCGRQPFRSLLKSRGYEYISSDIEQNAEGTVDIISALDKPLTTNLLEQKGFDLILCTEVLEHVADWDMAFQNLSTLTLCEGTVLLTCPHFYQLHEEPHDYWRPTLYAIEYFARRHGFIVHKQQMAGDAWDVLGTVLANATPYPVSRALHNRILARITRECQQFMFKLLSNHKLQNSVRLEGPLYMSNIVELQRV